MSTLVPVTLAFTSDSPHMKAPEKDRLGPILPRATSMSALLQIPAMVMLNAPTMTMDHRAALAMTVFTVMDTSAL